MATYFKGGSEFEAASAESTSDGMQTLFLMNSNYVVPYSHTHHLQSASSATNMFLLNPAGNALSPTNLTHAPPPSHHHHNLLLGPANSDDPHHLSSLHGGIVLSGASGVHLWGSSVDHRNSPPGSSHHPQVVLSVAAAANPGGAQDVASRLGLRQSVVSPPRQGNLSLSLSYSSQKVPYRSCNVESSDHIIQGQPPQALIMAPPPADDMTKPGNSPPSFAVSNGISGARSLVLGSKYSRAAQELLDEVVNVGKGIKTGVSDSTKETTTMKKESMAAVTDDGSSGGENSRDKLGGAELTTAQKRELQMKKAKLVTMLDEVEQRYRRYHHQMQVVASSFEQAAGFGAAKSYTTLALRTISKQFRCLKDAISGQIKATNKSLGEVEDCLGAKLEGSIRLRYVDQQVRQQRALQQQLGMIQHSNAWRPQRGLPERAVSVLRAWLFEHFLHPYPKDSDKHLLAKQTGLTKSQVSNWFINARVRLWKPMVEEMYLEEVKEQERNCSTTEDNNGNTSERNESGSSSGAQQNSESIKIDQAIKTLSKVDKSMNQINGSASEFSTSAIGEGSFLLPQTSFNLTVSSAMDDERLAKESYSFLTGTATHGGGFATYSSMGELTPSFRGRSSVSLTLGLPHCENLSLSGNQQNLLSNQNIHLGRRRLELGTSETDFSGINNTQQASHSSNDYDNIEMQNRKLFAAQLLPDFVT